MPRYRVVWPDVPREHRASYPARVQQQLDQRIEELLEDPRARARFYPGPRRDFWITTFGPNHEGTIEYSVREDPIPTVGIRRVSYLGDL
jgi:hypothetical protein